MYLEKYMLLEEVMETNFENKYTQVSESSKQLYLYWYYKQPLFLVIHILAGVNFLSGIAGIIINLINLEGTLFINSIENILPSMLFILIFEGILLFSYFANIKTMEKRNTELSRSEIECTVTVNADGITNYALESSQNVPLSSIKRAFTTKDYIFVVTRAKLVFILKKDSFTVGDTSGLLNFLRMKGVKVSGK